MRRSSLAAWTVGLAAALAATPLLGGDDAPPAKDGKTSARPTARSGFEALRKAAADKDDPTLLRCLPAALVAKWPELAKDDARPWRTALAGRIAEGTVVGVRESGDDAVARWKTATPAAEFELFMRLDGGHWVASSPWAWSVAGGDLAKANGKGPAKASLDARTSKGAYGPSAFSFAHVTKDPKQCKNRMDVWYCTAGHLHGSGGSMISPLEAKSLDAVDGIPRGGDSMDQVEPRGGKVYAVHCAREGRKDFHVVLQVKAVSASELAFEWRLAAAGFGAPANIHRPQPLVSNDGEDGWDQYCGK